MARTTWPSLVLILSSILWVHAGDSACPSGDNSCSSSEPSAARSRFGATGKVPPGWGKTAISTKDSRADDAGMGATPATPHQPPPRGQRVGPPFTSPETLFGAYAAFHRSILDSAKRDNRLPRILLCQPMYGIGNRMRAMMSCLLTGLGSFPSFSLSQC